jgi:uncharacterized membrane protein YtjA (UPF0391 family)
MWTWRATSCRRGNKAADGNFGCERTKSSIGAYDAHCRAVHTMRYWTLLFLVIAALAAFLGFGDAARTFAVTAKLVFYSAVVLLLVSLVGSLMRRV